jgi:hypothetical protein
VALKAVAPHRERDLQVDYLTATGFDLPYAVHTTETYGELWEGARSLVVSDDDDWDSAPAKTILSSWPLNLNFDSAPIRDLALTLDDPGNRTVYLTSAPGRIKSLRLKEVWNGNRPIVAIYGSVKDLDIGENWQIAANSTLDWETVDSLTVPYSMYTSLNSWAAKVPRLHVTNIVKTSVSTVTFLADGGVSVDNSQFPRISSSDLGVTLEFNGSCLTFNADSGECLNEGYLRLGNLTFGGSAPPANSEYVFDFLSSYVWTEDYLSPTTASGWTATSNVVIRARHLDFSTTIVGFSLSGVTMLNVKPTPSNSKVTFSGVVSTSSLVIGKPDATSVVFEHLVIDPFDEMGLASLEDFDCSSATACQGVEVRDLSTSAIVELPKLYNLTGQVTVSAALTVNDPGQFQATSLTISGSGSILFMGRVPALPANAGLVYNATGEREAGTYAAIRLHNESTSNFGEFHLNSDKRVVPIVCGRVFDNCTSWSAKFAENTTITGNELGDGAHYVVSYECAPRDDILWLDYPVAGYSGAKATGYPCLQAVFTIEGGDPSSPHYVPPGAGAENQNENEGIGTGTVVAIALGAVLLIVIVVVILLFLLGKLICGGKADDDNLNP